METGEHRDDLKQPRWLLATNCQWIYKKNANRKEMVAPLPSHRAQNFIYTILYIHIL